MFHPILFIFFESDFLRRELALEGQIFGLQIPHAGFDLFQIFRRERRLALKIVIESAVGWRTDAKLRLGKQLENSCRAKVSGRMPVDLQSLRVFVGQNLNCGVSLNRAVQVDGYHRA